MKVRIWLDIFESGMPWAVAAATDLCPLSFQLAAPSPGNKRYLVECEVPDPFPVTKIEGKVSQEPS